MAGLLAVAMMATAVSIALVGPSATAETRPVAGNKTYDGEAPLWGLFFGVGPVAEQYPKLVLTEIDETPERLDTVAGAIAEVEARDPGFLDRFGLAMYSGDRGVIGEVAIDAVGKLAEFVPGDPGGSGTALHKSLEELLAIVNGKPHTVGLASWAAAVAAKLSAA